MMALEKDITCISSAGRWRLKFWSQLARTSNDPIGHESVGRIDSTGVIRSEYAITIILIGDRRQTGKKKNNTEVLSIRWPVRIRVDFNKVEATSAIGCSRMVRDCELTVLRCDERCYFTYTRMGIFETVQPVAHRCTTIKTNFFNPILRYEKPLTHVERVKFCKSLSRINYRSSAGFFGREFRSRALINLARIR